MSRRAETLVWERSRAGKSDLLMLIKLADLADDDGCNAWPGVPSLMKYCRSSERATQYTLQRLERAGEIEIEYNDDNRAIRLRSGRTFQPKWFIHVRCVSAWEAYESEGSKSATPADSEFKLRRGRPRTKPATLADSGATKNRNSCVVNPQEVVDQSAVSRNAYKERLLSDPLVEQEQGDAPEKAVAAPRMPAADDAEKNIGIVTKIAHEVIDQLGSKSDDLGEAVKALCAQRRVAYRSDVVRKAIESATWQRSHRGVSA